MYTSDLTETFTLVLTASQREIFDEVKGFVLEHRGSLSPKHLRDAQLSMPNTFSAGDRKFINDLGNDLHLELAWDEYDEQDQNLVTLRFPGALEEPLPVNGNEERDEDGADDEWEDEDEEGREAVDRVLKKYEKAKVMNDAVDRDFDARYERSIFNTLRSIGT